VFESNNTSLLLRLLIGVLETPILFQIAAIDTARNAVFFQLTVTIIVQLK